VAAPRGRKGIPRVIGWTSSRALVGVDSVVLLRAFPLLAVGLALVANARGWALPKALDTPHCLAVLLRVLLLALTLNLQPVLCNAIHDLQRMQRMRHADLDFDVTTGHGFRALEIVVSMGNKPAVVEAAGAPALAVPLFDVLRNAPALLNTAKSRLHKGVHWVLRWARVTPDRHRLRQSVIQTSRLDISRTDLGGRTMGLGDMALAGRCWQGWSLPIMAEALAARRVL
jgi:hypothetical protein